MGDSQQLVLCFLLFIAHSRRGKVGLDEINGQSNRSHGDDQPEVACRPRTKKTSPLHALRSHLFSVNLMDQVIKSSSHQVIKHHGQSLSISYDVQSKFPADSQQIPMISIYGIYGASFAAAP